MRYSTKWKNWVALLDGKTCKPCKENHGKIYEINEIEKPSPPLHRNCRCMIKRLKSIFAGEATNKKQDGADWHLKYKGKLPDDYVMIDVAYSFGWKPKKGNFYDVMPNKIIAGGIYKNADGHLPEKEGRIWYEADINYVSGYRNKQRIVYSNDGLIFVTYDHYKTFAEIR